MVSRGVTLLFATVMAVALCGANSVVPRDDDEACTDNNGEICSNRGRCVDGACKCYGNRRFYGKLCQKNLSGRCPDLKPCVQCMAFGSGPIHIMDCHKTCLVDTDVADFRVVEEIPYEEMNCLYRDINDCLREYSYAAVNDKLKVKINFQIHCPHKTIVRED